MAKESGPNEPAESLKPELVRTRDRMARDLQGLRYELDIPRRLKTSFQQQTAVWIAAAVVLGAVVMMAPRGKRKIYVDAKGRETGKAKLLETGLLLGALRIAATLLRPAITDFIKNKVASSLGSSGRRDPW